MHTLWHEVVLNVDSLLITVLLVGRAVEWRCCGTVEPFPLLWLQGLKKIPGVLLDFDPLRSSKGSLFVAKMPDYNKSHNHNHDWPRP